MTFLHDLSDQTILNYSLVPAVYESGDDGQAVDLIEGDGSAFAIATIVAVSADNPIAVILQESSDLITWTTVAGGAFPTVTQGQDRTLILSFRRTKRYVRARFVFETVLSANIAVLIGQQKKTV
jgi:hypothetical protein